MKNTHRILFALVALSLLPAQAQAFDLAAVGVLNLSGTSIDPDPAGTEEGGKLGIGFGALAEMEWLPMIGIQFGLLYVKRTTTVTGPGLDSQLSANMLQIPVMVRISPIDFVSVGAGGYYAFAAGDLTARDNVTGLEVSTPFDSTNVSKSDVGLILGAALKFPIAPTLSLLADARYLLGLKDLDTTGATTSRTRDFQFLVGLNFGL
jgi:hypothetical protein